MAATSHLGTVKRAAPARVAAHRWDSSLRRSKKRRSGGERGLQVGGTSIS